MRLIKTYLLAKLYFCHYRSFYYLIPEVFSGNLVLFFCVL